MASIVLLSAAMSLDAMAAAFSYKVRKIHLPAQAYWIIGLSSFAYAAIAVWAGNWAAEFLPATFATRAGAALLALLGAANIIKAATAKESAQGPIMSHKAQRSGEKPMKMSSGEAFWLGIALSLDSVSAGWSYSLFGGSQRFLPVFIALFQTFFLWIGAKAGEKASHRLQSRLFDFAPGAALLIIAFFRVF